MDTVLVEGEGNLDGTGLSVGEDQLGKKYRTVLHVDLDQFNYGELLSFSVFLVNKIIPLTLGNSFQLLVKLCI